MSRGPRPRAREPSTDTPRLGAGEAIPGRARRDGPEDGPPHEDPSVQPFEKSSTVGNLLWSRGMHSSWPLTDLVELPLSCTLCLVHEGVIGTGWLWELSSGRGLVQSLLRASPAWWSRCPSRCLTSHRFDWRVSSPGRASRNLASGSCTTCLRGARKRRQDEPAQGGASPGPRVGRGPGRLVVDL
mgnify:CR=1 FL=1